MQTSEPTFAIVATTLYVLLVDLQTKNVVPLENRRPEYYGISWLPGADELVLSHSAIDNASLTDLASFALSETGYVSRGESVTSGFLSQPHQILCGSDGRVICTNTGRNAISVIDLDNPGYMQETRSSPARWDRLSREEAAGDHINSLFEKDGLLYVIAHGHKTGSSLITLSYPDLQIVSREPVKGRTGLHNIWVTDEGQKISCHSEPGTLFEINSGEVLWESGSPIYTRGLAASDEFVLVGESQKLGRDLRSASISGLWLVDRKTWQTLDYFCLGPYGAVHEVRLLNIPDIAHHGRPFGGLSKLLARNLRSTMAAEKIQMSAAARRCRNAWKEFTVVMGTPIHGEQGAFSAEEGVCLVTCPATEFSSFKQTDPALTFRYSLSCAENSHVSVICYLGNGGDSDMQALLIQPSANQVHASLSLWIHDGESWLLQPEVAVDGLPIVGDIAVHVDMTQLELRLDGLTIIELSSQALRLHEGRLGVRWVGATIYPLFDTELNA